MNLLYFVGAGSKIVDVIPSLSSMSVQSQAADVIQHGAYTIVIDYDHDPESPRSWDNLGTMVCFHRNYNLGDKHDETPESLREIVARPDVIALPLYLIDHSGLSMRTRSFSDVDPGEWDSGCVGAIYVTHETIRKEYGDTTPETLEKVRAFLVSEVETYDQYLTGDVYGFRIFRAGEDDDLDDAEELESCWGFFGIEYAKESAIEQARYLEESEAKEHQERVKTWIRNRVPLLARV